MPRIGGRALGRIAAVFSLLFFAQARAENNPISKLSEITIDDVDDEIVIGIKGSRLPDFTSFTMHEPYRVVIDWAGSELADVPRTQRFERSLIRSIVTEQFSSESEKISRVVIELAVHTRYRFESVDREVFVRLKKATLPLVPEAEEAKGVQPEFTDPNQAAIASLGDEPIPEGPLTEPRDVPAPPPPTLVAPISERLLADITPPVEPKTPPAQVSLASIDAKPEAANNANPQPAVKPTPVVEASPKAVKAKPIKEQLAKKVNAVEATTPKPVVLARLKTEVSTPVANNIDAPKAIGIKAAPEEASKNPPKLTEVPAAKPNAQSPSPPTVRLASSARIAPKPTPEVVEVEELEVEELEVEELEVEELEVEDIEEKPTSEKKESAAPSARLASVSAKTAASTPAPPQQPQRLAQLKAAPAPPPPASPTVAKPGKTWIKSVKKANSLAAIARPQAAPRPQRLRRLKGKVRFDGTTDFKPGTRIMKYIGFRQKASISEVFVRCDGKAKYQVIESSNTKVVLQLYDTVIRVKNNQRALDTSFFPTAVNRVHAKSDAAGTRVEISLRHKVPYEVKRVGSTIKLLFKNNAR